MYFMPAVLAMSAQASASKCSGWNWSASLAYFSTGTCSDHCTHSPRPGIEYTPQCRNIPNRASRHHSMRWDASGSETSGAHWAFERVAPMKTVRTSDSLHQILRDNIRSPRVSKYYALNSENNASCELNSLQMKARAIIQCRSGNLDLRCQSLSQESDRVPTWPQLCFDPPIGVIESYYP